MVSASVKAVANISMGLSYGVSPGGGAKEGNMAKILEFPKSAEQTREQDVKGTASVAHTQSAEIIIFPGVRIERQLHPRSAINAPTSANTNG